MKKATLRLGSLLLTLTLLLGLVPALPAAADAADPAQALLQSMTTQEKVSQVLMPTFRKFTDASGQKQEVTQLNEAIEGALARHGFAGVILFSENTPGTEQTLRLTDAFQRANAGEGRSQLLISIDQEGGNVTRLGEGTQTPGNMALGAVNDLTATREMADILGRELLALGVNWDFAPVLDVNNNPGNPVIGPRSFSDDPQVVAEQGVAFMQALRATGAISTLKHFPGHGDTGTDSHTGLPCITKTYDQLKSCELLPFRACIEAGAEAIMTAHIQYPLIETGAYVSKATGEPVSLPATLSKTILTDILRGDLGFEGVIVTDAMTMDAIATHFDPIDAAVLALNAGADLLLMPVDTSTPTGIADLDAYIDALTRRVESGDVPLSTLDAAVLRVLRLKESKGLLTPYAPSGLEERLAAALSTVGSPANHEKEWEVAKRSITLVKNKNQTLPLVADHQKIVILTPYDDEPPSVEYAVNLLRDQGKLDGERTSVTVDTYQGRTFDQVRELVRGADHVMLVSETYSAAALDPNAPEGRGEKSALLDRVMDFVHAQGGTTSLLSVYLPYDAARYDKADAVLLAWSARIMNEDPRQAEGPIKQYGANIPAAVVLALSLEESPTGKLPVDLPALDEHYHFTDSILYPRGFGLTYPALSCEAEGVPCPLRDYWDLDPTKWYHDGVSHALSAGLMTGTGSRSFTPGGAATRAMAVTVLWNLAGRPVVNAPLPFTDVPPDKWYTEAVRWAAAQGIVSGYGDGRFGPGDAVTRQQLAGFFFRASGAEEAEDMGLAGYEDASQISSWAWPSMVWAVKSGLISGTSSSTLSPRSTATRAQLAALITSFSALPHGDN